jgi:hypothetical protein
LGYPRSGLSRSDFVHWHETDHPGHLDDVRCSGKTRSGWRQVKPTRLTHFGYRQQFSEPCDLTAWGKHQSERSQRL